MFCTLQVRSQDFFQGGFYFVFRNNFVTYDKDVHIYFRLKTAKGNV